jgi:hypothetical protein
MPLLHTTREINAAILAHAGGTGGRVTTRLASGELVEITRARRKRDVLQVQSGEGWAPAPYVFVDGPKEQPAPRDFSCVKCGTVIRMPVDLAHPAAYGSAWSGEWCTDIDCPICRADRGGSYPLTRMDTPVLFTNGALADLADTELAAEIGDAEVVDGVLNGLQDAVERLRDEGFEVPWELTRLLDCARELLLPTSDEEAPVFDRAGAEELIRQFRARAIEIAIEDHDHLCVRRLPGDDELVAWALSHGWAAVRVRRRDPRNTGSRQLPEHWLWAYPGTPIGGGPAVRGSWSDPPALSEPLRDQIRSHRTGAERWPITREGL